MMKIFNLQNNENFYNLIRLIHMAWPIKFFKPVQTSLNRFEKYINTPILRNLCESRKVEEKREKGSV